VSESVITSVLLLAQEAAQPAPESPGASLLLPLIAIPLLFYFLILKPQKTKDQQMKNMISNLKEKDRVVTIGGIHGVVTNVQRDQDLVTLRVDEATGAKIKIGASAIARVVTDDEEKKSE
jgi:preprotein translocase subunit YajC